MDGRGDAGLRQSSLLGIALWMEDMQIRVTLKFLICGTRYQKWNGHACHRALMNSA
jgi:hypothetical protein